MIDHVLGRPSTRSRRLQVLAVLSLWGLYLHRGARHGPPGVRRLSSALSRRLTPWQVCALTMLALYAARNFSALAGLASPEPMANMYDPAFYRATWVLTALDAGFWTAMRIRRPRWLRDLAAIVFSAFYLVAADRADEKVRKVRGLITVEHMRVAWNKGTTPYLRVLQSLVRPRFTKWPPRRVRIPRPADSDYSEPVAAWLYYDGPLANLAAVGGSSGGNSKAPRLILDVPGGGFVAMDPRCHDDKLFAWATRSGLPVLSLDYKKAPEHPYPYALNEVFDVYSTIIRTRGKCIGMSGQQTPRIVVTGDSAGGNLAVAATLMILETTTTSSSSFRRRTRGKSLPPPDGLVCFYPTLDMNIGNWMTDEQMSLIRDRKFRKTNQAIVRKKSMQYNAMVGTPYHSDEDESPAVTDATKVEEPNMAVVVDQLRDSRPEFSHGGVHSLSQPTSPETATKASVASGGGEASTTASHHPKPLRTRLATSSMISYVNDRVLTPEMMRAMIILYIGEHNRPDFAQDYLLSPVLAPEYLLARFPKTYLMTGERDPLVDDTVIFAGRLRRAKETGLQLGMAPEETGETDTAPEVVLIPGASHGFMQFPGVYPASWRHFERSADWFEHLFAEAEEGRGRQVRARAGRRKGDEVGRMGAAAAESSGDEDRPLEIGMTKMGRGRGATSAARRGGEEAEEEEEEGGRGKRGKRKIRKNKSLVKLKSTDDLLGRRMAGLASGLTGTGDEDDD